MKYMPKNHYYNSNMKEKVDRKQQSSSLCIASEYGSKCQMTSIDLLPAIIVKQYIWKINEHEKHQWMDIYAK